MDMDENTQKAGFILEKSPGDWDCSPTVWLEPAVGIITQKDTRGLQTLTWVCTQVSCWVIGIGKSKLEKMEGDVPSKKQGKLLKVGEELQSLNETEEVPSPLMFLPKEIWTHIFNFVPQRHRMKHRMVSKEWCKNIDEFSTVDVNFNEDYPSEQFRDRVFALRIRSCIFSSLHVPFSPDFKNPLLVKEITFTTHVSAPNVLSILSVCKNIESLRFLTTMSSETALEVNERTTKVFNNLKNLQYLEIGILTFLDRNQGQESCTFKAILGNENVVFSSLRALNVAFLVRHTEWFQIFKFISRHSGTLKSLNTICPCGDRLKRPKDLIPTNLVLPQLESLVVNGASDCSCREDVWLLLDQQKQLRRFESDVSRGLEFLSDIIQRNQNTIRVLKLHEVGNIYSDELDCKVFSKCINLQELSLYIAGDCGCVIVVNVGGGPPQQRMPILCNLGALPKGLRRLTLCGSQILSDELERLFSPGRALEEITLGRADSMKVETTGMTVKILGKMLESLERLKKFRIFLDMICEQECKQVDYCGELTGIWRNIFEISKEMNSGSGAQNSNDDATCCGEKYNDESCVNHCPFIDMLFKTNQTRLEFLGKVKELLDSNTG